VGAAQVKFNNIGNACVNDVGAKFRTPLFGWLNNVDAQFSSSPPVAVRDQLIGAAIDHELTHGIGPDDHAAAIVTISMAPQRVNNWYSTNGAVFPPVRNYMQNRPGADESRTCPMRYPFPEVMKCFALQYDLIANEYKSVSPGWAPPTLPLLTGYCTVCSPVLRIKDF
jgi:hypothetical protein